MSDLIDRQAAIDAAIKESNTDGAYGYMDTKSIINLLNDLPPAEPEPNYDEWCTDCKEYDQERHCCPRWNRVIREALKDAQPERKTGKWIWEIWDKYRCSECETKTSVDECMEWPMYAYCPYCGARMEGVNETD